MEVQLIVKQEVYRQEQFYLKSASVGFVFYINKIVMTKKSTWNNILRGCYFNSNITLEKKKQERTKPSPAEQIPLSINKCQRAASSHVQENSIPAYRDVRSLAPSLPPSFCSLCCVDTTTWNGWDEKVAWLPGNLYYCDKRQGPKW